jgi:hypothetical protein
MFLASIASAQTNGGSGIVYGADHSFFITAPEGWVLDIDSGVSQGLHAVFYREGESWARAGVVMYVNTASKRVDGQRTLKELMDYDIGQFTKKSSALRVASAPTLMAHGRKAEVLTFEGDQFGNYEAVAYIDEEHTVVMLVMTSHTKGEYERAYPDFEKFVASYQFLTSNVDLPR